MSFDTRTTTTPEVVQEETPKVLTVSQLISHIKDDGMTRDDIRKKYGLTIAEKNAIFSHPKLKGIRVGKPKAARVQLVDDTVYPAGTQVTLQQNIAEVSTHTDNQAEIQDNGYSI